MIVDELPPSRTRKKKADQEMKKLGDRLVALPPNRLEGMGLPGELVEAVALARRITSHGARRRQMQYIGALLRNLDPEAVRDALEGLRRNDRRRTLDRRRLANWCAELAAGSREPVAEILRRYPDLERQQFLQLVRNARAEAVSGTGSRSAGKLYRYLSRLAGQSMADGPPS